MPNGDNPDAATDGTGNAPRDLLIECPRCGENFMASNGIKIRVNTPSGARVVCPDCVDESDVIIH